MPNSTWFMCPPAAEAFGVQLLHLAMIFLVNLDLGYWTPAVGMNLFLAASRFERPLFAIYRSGLPFLLLLLAVMLLVTYVPALIIGAGSAPGYTKPRRP